MKLKFPLKSVVATVFSLTVFGMDFRAVAQPDAVDPRVRTFVYPTRVLWQTESQTFDDGWVTRRQVLHAEKLLETKHGQVSEGYFGSPAATKLVNRGGNLGTDPEKMTCFRDPLAFSGKICHTIPVPRKGCWRGGRL